MLVSEKHFWLSGEWAPPALTSVTSAISFNFYSRSYISACNILVYLAKKPVATFLALISKNLTFLFLSLKISFNLKQFLASLTSLHHNVTLKNVKLLNIGYLIFNKIFRKTSIPFALLVTKFKSFTLNWSSLVGTKNFLEVKYLARILIKQLLLALYNLKIKVSKSLETFYNIASLLVTSLTICLKYNIYVVAKRFFNSLHDLRSLMITKNVLFFNSRSLVSKFLPCIHNTKQLIFEYLALIYELTKFQIITKLLIMSHSIQKIIEKIKEIPTWFRRPITFNVRFIFKVKGSLFTPLKRLISVRSFLEKQLSEVFEAKGILLQPIIRLVQTIGELEEIFLKFLIAKGILTEKIYLVRRLIGKKDIIKLILLLLEEESE